MGEKKQCQYCENPATIHLSQIVDKQIHKIDLCESCAAKKGFTQPEDFSLDELLELPQDTNSEDTASSPDSCDAYGSTFEDFKKTGRLGSAECYTRFKDQLEPILRDMQRGTRHAGKHPSSFNPEYVAVYSNLRKELDLAVKEERYEDAALIRDKIDDIKNSLTTKAKE